MKSIGFKIFLKIWLFDLFQSKKFRLSVLSLLIDFDKQEQNISQPIGDLQNFLEYHIKINEDAFEDEWNFTCLSLLLHDCETL